MDRFSITQAIQPKTNDGQSPACLQSGARWGHAAPRPLRPEARQMVVDLHGRSADASRIVQARLPICTAIVTQFVTHFGANRVTRSEPRW
jgi:hypothetical protein